MSARPEGTLLTLPNALGAVRFLGSPGLVYLGAAGREGPFLLLFVFLTFTDWIDGKLAVWLEQRSPLGARVDTMADAAMYGCLLAGLVWLEGSVLLGEWPWIAAGCASWGLSAGASLLKFGTLPSYHTRLAKVSWFLALVAVVALLGLDHLWPFRLAAAAVTLTNLEGALITRALDEARSDVSSLGEVRAAGRARGGEGEV